MQRHKSEQKRIKEMDDVMLQFGMGARTCIGWQEHQFAGDLQAGTDNVEEIRGTFLLCHLKITALTNNNRSNSNIRI
jgi:hypothetical protein